MARRINAQLQWRRLLGGLLTDVFLAELSLFLWCAQAEITVLGFLAPATPRRFALAGDGIVRLYYFFGSEPEHAVYAGGFAALLIVGLGVFFALQTLGWLTRWFSGARRIRRQLRPIDSIANAASAMSAAEPDEELFRGVADAIDHLNAASPGAHLSLEGQGSGNMEPLETAVNSLINRMRESYRQQIRFVDDASHELRTPIAVIQGYANMLDRWGKDDPKVLQESITAIRTESEHMKTLVDQLLFLARGDMGRQKFSPQPVELEKMLQELRDESVLIDAKHHYRLRIAAPCTVSADPAMLKQAVRILVDNAAKYTPEGGDVTLGLKTEGGDALLSVQDTGCGVTREDAAHVFERFYRGDRARAETGGSGLGLAIAKWIVDQHGGRFSLVSYTGVGSRFTIRLPAQTAPPALPPDGKKQKQPRCAAAG